LAISYSIIKKHGGHIRVHSEPQKGTIFYVYIPSWEGEAKHRKTKPKEVYAGKGRLLVMDDEEMIRATLRESLEYLGYEVITVPDGQAAVAEVKKALEEGRPFDLAILDLTIPGGVGGKKVLYELRRLDPKLKAVVASGYADDPAFTDFQRYGFQAVLKKPFTLQELSNILHEVLGEK
jgi:CheY-like chemotaxis protein